MCFVVVILCIINSLLPPIVKLPTLTGRVLYDESFHSRIDRSPYKEVSYLVPYINDSIRDRAIETEVLGFTFTIVSAPLCN